MREERDLVRHRAERRVRGTLREARDDLVDRGEDALQAGLFPLARQKVHLQEALVGLLLHLDQIGNLDEEDRDCISRAMPSIKGDKLRAIAITSKKRSPLLPNVPTFAEAGYPGFEATVWWGVLAPAATPKDVIAKLNAEIVKAMRAPDMKEKFAELGAETTPSTPEQFGVFLKQEIDKWAGVIKASGIRAD